MSTSEIPTPVRELLAAVLEAIDLPMPDITETDERRAAAVQRDRTRVAAIVTRGVLERGHDPGHGAAYLRRRVAEVPADYCPWTGPQQGGGEGR
ncbi:hypothetical protein IQ279_04660 [Streptomyces verrucosisporus]|uniref:hypothetical protein n=1 Tax=Streptomyces verrucosisporus TaxID=1695161 RepID=UPI0019D1122C|nr:hypothetical protein [Streptomyces verrucosisporus]MBN3928937.1 hypothetical protein [Streptomyces verrucosisporus]